MTERDAKPEQPAIFFDLGGTLLALDDKADIARDARNRVTPLPGVVARLLADHASGHRIYVLTNQSGVSRGEVAGTDIADWIEQLNAATDGSIDDYAFCPHPIAAACPCRKPRPGLIETLGARHGTDLTKAILVGDSDQDRDCAEAAGIARFHWAHDYFRA